MLISHQSWRDPNGRMSGDRQPNNKATTRLGVDWAGGEALVDNEYRDTCVELFGRDTIVDACH